MRMKSRKWGNKIQRNGNSQVEWKEEALQDDKKVWVSVKARKKSTPSTFSVNCLQEKMHIKSERQ